MKWLDNIILRILDNIIHILVKMSYRIDQKQANKTTCPNCQSTNVKPVEPFDYVQQCLDCGKQFSTGEHN